MNGPLPTSIIMAAGSLCNSMLYLESYYRPFFVNISENGKRQDRELGYTIVLYQVVQSEVVSGGISSCKKQSEFCLHFLAYLQY